MVLSIMIVVGATGYLSYSRGTYNCKNIVNCISDTFENDSITEQNNYDYGLVKGLYMYTSDVIKDDIDEFQASYRLYLYENGMFKYEMSTHGPFGYIGNYTIEDNEIKLNYLFETNGGASINVVSGTKNITIDESGNLIDNKQSINSVNLTSVTLTKDSSEVLDYNNLFNILDNYIIENNAE